MNITATKKLSRFLWIFFAATMLLMRSTFAETIEEILQDLSFLVSLEQSHKFHWQASGGPALNRIRRQFPNLGGIIESAGNPARLPVEEYYRNLEGQLGIKLNFELIIRFANMFREGNLNSRELTEPRRLSMLAEPWKTITIQFLIEEFDHSPDLMPGLVSLAQKDALNVDAKFRIFLTEDYKRKNFRRLIEFAKADFDLSFLSSQLEDDLSKAGSEYSLTPLHADLIKIVHPSVQAYAAAVRLAARKSSPEVWDRLGELPVSPVVAEAGLAVLPRLGNSGLRRVLPVLDEARPDKFDFSVFIPALSSSNAMIRERVFRLALYRYARNRDESLQFLLEAASMADDNTGTVRALAQAEIQTRSSEFELASHDIQSRLVEVSEYGGNLFDAATNLVIKNPSLISEFIESSNGRAVLRSAQSAATKQNNGGQVGEKIKTALIAWHTHFLDSILERKIRKWDEHKQETEFRTSVNYLKLNSPPASSKSAQFLKSVMARDATAVAREYFDRMPPNPDPQSFLEYLEGNQFATSNIFLWTYARNDIDGSLSYTLEAVRMMEGRLETILRDPSMRTPEGLKKVLELPSRLGDFLVNLSGDPNYFAEKNQSPELREIRSLLSDIQRRVLQEPRTPDDFLIVFNYYRALGPVRWRTILYVPGISPIPRVGNPHKPSNISVEELADIFLRLKPNAKQTALFVNILLHTSQPPFRYLPEYALRAEGRTPLEALLSMSTGSPFTSQFANSMYPEERNYALRLRRSLVRVFADEAESITPALSKVVEDITGRKGEREYIKTSGEFPYKFCGDSLKQLKDYRRYKRRSITKAVE